jgi:hypothetical protein
MIDLARTLKLYRGALFDAEATWRSYLPEAGDWKKTALLLTVPLIIAATIIAYVLGILGSGASLLGLRPTLASSAYSIVMGVIAAGVIAFIFSALSGVFGGKNSFALGLAATTLAFVPGYTGQALSGLPWIGWLLALGLGIYGLVLLWRIIPLYLEVPSGKRVVHYIVSLVACIVVFFVLSSVIGGALFGSGAGPGFGGLSGRETPRTEGSDGGLFGGLGRQAELIAAADEDRYEPPADGELTERQVEEFIRVMDRVGEAMAARDRRLQEIAERADRDEQVSFRDLGSVMSGVTEIAGLSTVEIEVVKSAGGNWAEHQWVKEALRTAWLQKDINDTVAHNYALYEQHEAQLAEHIAH